MIRYRPQFAGALGLVALLWLSSASAQEPADTMRDSLVLVLNLLSGTHARPTTGVIISRPDSRPALVVVPSGFVGPGDEIVVLDGGVDLTRNGRATRTVARSAKAGIAILEVKDLQRAGVALSADDWPPPQASRYEFAAWPEAEALAEGAPLRRQMLGLEAVASDMLKISGDQQPTVNGPLFNRCGQLAGFYLVSDPPLVRGAAEIAEVARKGVLEVEQKHCDGPATSQAAAEQAEAAPEDFVAPAQAAGEASTADFTAYGDLEAPLSPTDEVLETSAQGSGDTIWMAVLLVLAAAAIFFRFYRGGSGSDVILEGGASGEKPRKHELSFGPEKRRDRFKRGALGLTFEIRENGVLAWDTSEEDTRLSVVVNETAFYHGERFYVESGQEIRLGEASYKITLDLANKGK